MACIPLKPGQSREELEKAKSKLLVEKERLTQRIQSNAVASANFSTPQALGANQQVTRNELIEFPVYWEVITRTSTFVAGGSTEPYLTSDADEVFFTFLETGKLYTLERSDQGTTSPAHLANPSFNANLSTHKILATVEITDAEIEVEDDFVPSDETLSYIFVPEDPQTQRVNGKNLNFSYLLDFNGTKEFTITVFVIGPYQGATPLPNFSYGFSYQVPPQELGLTESAPATPTSFVSDYEVNPLKPYGGTWKTVRPPGYPKDGPPASTKSSGEAVLRQALSELGTLNISGLPDSFKVALTTGFNWLQTDSNLKQFTECLRKLAFLESGLILYNTITKFDIRDPEPPGARDNLNLPDQGPFPRGSGKQYVNSPKRPRGKKYASDCGIFQYTATTYRGLLKKYHTVFGINEADIPTMFVWDTATKVQIYLQGLEILRKVFVPCINAGIPPVYRAILCYCYNGMPGPTNRYISLAAASVAALGANASELSIHLACKRVYDSKSWIDVNDRYQPRFWNNCSYKMAHSPYGLPRQFPEIFLNNPAVFPNTPSKI